MSKKVQTFLICVLIPVTVGILAGLLTRGSMASFRALNQPPLSPPAWLFPVVWTILYILMGIASYLVVTSGKGEDEIRSALTIYGVQLIVNFLWSFIFFTFELYCFAFIWLIFLWILIIITIRLFSQISNTAGKLLIPYLIWVTFAGYLNLSICILN